MAERRHHLKQHPPVLVEDLLLETIGTVDAAGSLVHYVVNDFAHGVLAFLKELNLFLEHPRLLVHKRLGDGLGVLGLKELLAHLTQKCVHLLVGHCLQLSLVVLDYLQW